LTGTVRRIAGSDDETADPAGRVSGL
jgi:hypothetical protein